MRTRTLALTATAALALTGCAPDGVLVTPDTMPAESLALVEAGLDALAARPIIALEGTQNSLTSNVDEVQVSWQVTAGGFAYGTAATGEYETGMLSAEGLVFVRASEDFWLADSNYEESVKGIGDDWARVYDQGWIDPGEFMTPPVYADGLREAMDEAGVFFRPLPEAVAYAGGLAHPVEVGEGTVHIAPDGAIVGIEGVAVTGLKETGVDFTGNVTFPDRAAVESLREEVLGEVATLGKVRWYDNIFSSLEDEQVDIDCANGGVCTLSMKVGLPRAEEEKDDDFSFMVELSARAWVTDGDEESCTDRAEVAAGKTVKLSCKARVRLTGDAETWISGEGTAQMLYAIYRTDVAGLTEAVGGELERTLAASG
ncbi:hypothetical protein AB0I28_22265 [Phytomonospora sp. NPDC050363]|uniref:hypothetical protein n=1 Tax=Phytomonospora sp. NPDC050363 TaxID=3155642 RepID=UPI0033F53A1A